MSIKIINGGVNLKKNSYFGLLIAFLLVFAAACGSSETETSTEPTNESSTTETSEEDSDTSAEEKGIDYPTKPLDWTIAFGPGGGNDIMGRTLIDILKKYDLYSENIVPENRAGGSGAVGWGYLNNHKGDPYQLSTTSGSFITTPLLSEPGFNYESFTHIALMATDDLFLAVSGDSPYNTLEEFIAAAKTEEFAIAGIGAANVDRFVAMILAREAGYEFEYVPFNAQGEVITALLSNAVDAVMTNPAEVVGQIEAGELKALAFSGQVRLDSFPDVRTLKELGYNASVPAPRGIVMAGDVPDEVVQWWIETMKKVAETPEWQAYIDENYLTEYILYGGEFTEYLDEINGVFEDLMKELEIID